MKQVDWPSICKIALPAMVGSMLIALSADSVVLFVVSFVAAGIGALVLVMSVLPYQHRNAVHIAEKRYRERQSMLANLPVVSDPDSATASYTEIAEERLMTSLTKTESTLERNPPEQMFPPDERPQLLQEMFACQSVHQLEPALGIVG